MLLYWDKQYVHYLSDSPGNLLCVWLASCPLQDVGQSHLPAKKKEQRNMLKFSNYTSVKIYVVVVG